MNILNIFGIVLAVLALILAFHKPREKVQYYFRKFFKIRKESIEIQRELIPYRIQLVLRSGSQFIETAFALPILEEELFRQVLNQRAKIFVLSPPGFGKTQLTKELFNKFIVEHPNSNIAYISPKMRQEGSLDCQISLQFNEDLNELPKKFNKKDLFIIIIDGLDELHDDERKSLLNEVEKWIARGASVFATSRSISSLPSNYRKFYDFYTIQPLSEEKIFQLIESWGINENFPNTQEIKKQIQAQLGEESIWAPGEYDVAYTSPFYLVNTCKYFQETGEIPNNRILILASIVKKSLKKINNPTLAEKILMRIAELARMSMSTASVPMVNADVLEDTGTFNIWDEFQGVDCRIMLDDLLHTDLLVKIGNSVSFGIHGLLYHFYAAKNLINKGNITASALKGQHRNTVELVLAKLPKEEAVCICEDLLNEVEKLFPQKEKIISDEESEVDLLLPFFGLSSINYLNMEIVDRFVESGINRFRVNDGPTRWKGIEMVVSLGQHARVSKKLIEAISEKEPDVTADVAEVLCWLGNKRRGWRRWALEGLERITKYVMAPHPLFHVMEAVERLKIENDPLAIRFLKHLSKHENELVKFMAISLLGENKGSWMELAIRIIEWIQICEKKNEIDYKICHGYHALHWFNHHIFQTHPVIERAKELVKNRFSMLCESDSCPFYWIWYLGGPIKQLDLFEHCKEKFSNLLLNKNIPDGSKKTIRNFIVSVGGTQ